MSRYGTIIGFLKTTLFATKMDDKMINIPILLQVSVAGSCNDSMGLTLLLSFLLLVLVIGLCYNNIAFYDLI